MQKTGSGIVCYGDATLPSSDLKRSKDVSSLMGASKAALRFCSQAATVEAWLKIAKQSFSPTGMRVAVI
jgi:hypothetical protein